MIQRIFLQQKTFGLSDGCDRDFVNKVNLAKSVLSHLLVLEAQDLFPEVPPCILRHSPILDEQMDPVRPILRGGDADNGVIHAFRHDRRQQSLQVHGGNLCAVGHQDTFLHAPGDIQVPSVVNSSQIACFEIVPVKGFRSHFRIAVVSVHDLLGPDVYFTDPIDIRCMDDNFCKGVVSHISHCAFALCVRRVRTGDVYAAFCRCE